MSRVLGLVKAGLRRVRSWSRACRGLVRRYYEPVGGLFTPDHLPARFSRRAGDFTVNLCGALDPCVRRARFRLNDGPWCPVRHALPRVPPPLVTAEFAHADLLAGDNRVEFELTTYRGRLRRQEFDFRYDPSAITLPAVLDWRDAELDSQDGRWERVEGDGVVRVRPVPGEERYDRILVVCGAFEGGREIALDLVFRGEKSPGRPFGFGVLPMWGGRPDSQDARPRRGWNFSLVWFYSHYDAVGSEFSFKDADDPPAWTAAYRSIDLARDTTYRLLVRCWPERDEDGGLRRHVQRMKWWPADQPEPEAWMTLTDDSGAPIPDREYGVALIAHQCQVEFGAVRVGPYERSGSRAGGSDRHG